MSLPNPNNDGIDHINIYSKGKTELGKLLSNFTQSRIETIDGQFDSVEAYWYWLKCENSPRREELRFTHGKDAKTKGRELLKEIENDSFDKPGEDSDQFVRKIKDALKIKICTNKRLLALLLNSKLPFKHYYNYSGKVIDARYEWIVEYIEQVRTFLQEKQRTK